MSTQTTAPVCLTKLQKRHLVADKTIALQLEKPPGFTFRPGQWIDLTLLHPRERDAKGDTRGFSIASAPHEDFLLVATRLRDTAFKRQLTDLPIGAEFKLDGPGGNLALHNNPARAAIFLVGGIGITPVRSILLRAAHDRLPQRIFVFYSNRRPSEAAFLEELTALQQNNPNYKLIATMTQADGGWPGETERIGPSLLMKYTAALPSPIYYVVGPPGMVNGARAMLNQTGVDDDDIRSEDFGGY